MAMKMMKKILAAAAAAALVATAIPAVPAHAAGVLATYDFENGTTGLTSTGYGADPEVVSDSEMGNVLELKDGATSEYVSQNVEGSDDGTPETKGIQNTKINIGSPSSMSMPNPFSGKSLSSMAFSMWVKVPAGGSSTGAGILGFVSSNVTRPHPDAVTFPDDPTKAAMKASTGPFAFGICASNQNEGNSPLGAIPMINMAFLHHNWFCYYDEEGVFDTNADKWVHMIVSIDGPKYTDVNIYVNGTNIGGTQASGKRFGHGQTDWTSDPRDTPENATEPLLTELLCMAETSNVYVGFTGYSPTLAGTRIDDITFYDAGISESEAMNLYNQANAAKSTKTGTSSAGTTGGNSADASGDANTGDGSSNTGGGSNSTSGSNTTTGNKSTTGSTAKTNNSNLPQTGVVETGVLVACGAAAVAGGAVLFKKKDKKEEN